MRFPTVEEHRRSSRKRKLPAKLKDEPMPIVETDPELRFRRHFPTIAGPVSSVARKRLFASLPARGGRGTGDMEGGMPHANGPALLAASSNPALVFNVGMWKQNIGP